LVVVVCLFAEREVGSRLSRSQIEIDGEKMRSVKVGVQKAVGLGNCRKRKKKGSCVRRWLALKMWLPLRGKRGCVAG
jgi:hypothetical protein